MQAKDLMRPGAVALAVAAAAALGFAAGWLLARNPELARRAARSLAGGWERVGGALAESREELADLWAEARENARATVDDEAFSAAAAAAAAASAMEQAARAPVAPPAAARKRAPTGRKTVAKGGKKARAGKSARGATSAPATADS